MSQFRKVNMLKNSLILAVYVTINLSVKLRFVFVNGPRQTYFVNALHRFNLDFELFKSDAISKIQIGDTLFSVTYL